MVFGHFIVRHGYVISPAGIDIQFEAGFLQLSLPFAASSAEVQNNLRPDISWEGQKISERERER